MSKKCDNSVREAAYYLWQNAGSPMGQDDYFWALAVNQFGDCGCKNPKSSSTAKKAKTSAVKKVSTTKKASAAAKKTSTKKATASIAKKK